MVVINKLTQTLMENRENQVMIEDILSEILGRKITLKLSFENKESYFAKKMAGN